MKYKSGRRKTCGGLLLVIAIWMVVIAMMWYVTSTSLNAAETAETEFKVEETAEIEETSEIEETEKLEVSQISNLEEYRSEVVERLNSGGDFLTDEEKEFLEKCDFSIRNSEGAYVTTYDSLFNYIEQYYYPIVDNTYLWYTTSNGIVYQEKLSENSLSRGYSTWVGNAHISQELRDKCIDECTNWSLVYDQATGKVERWFFGIIQETYQMPSEAVFTGESFWEGYLFRKGTDLYTLDESNNVYKIAQNVQMVLAADYYFNSDAWSQPLLLMTNGQVKVYVGWEGNQEQPDAEDHLCDIAHEGGYH